MNDEFTDIMARLSENARFALQKADMFSKKYNNGYTGTEHILMGILAQDTSTAAKILHLLDIRISDIEKLMGEQKKDISGSAMAMMALSEAAVLTLRLAADIADNQDLRVIGTEYLLSAILKQENSSGARILEKLGLDIDEVREDLDRFLMQQAMVEKVNREKKAYRRQPELRFLNKYAENLTKMAEEGRLDKVIGREKEINRAIVILSRRNKSNPVLIGEAGVGKTAIVEGLAQRVAENTVPITLLGKQIYQVDLAAMVAGTKFRGEFEERIKGMMDEAARHPEIILFIDELHLLAGAGSSEGSMDAANILKPALARGKIKLIGATTSDEYRKSIEKDRALARRFQEIIVEEPSDEVVFQIIKGVKSNYEKHHGVEIPDEVIRPAIMMAKRYINDRQAPDKVIDVIDEAAAGAKMAEEKESNFEYRKYFMEKQGLEEKIAELLDENIEAMEKKMFQMGEEVREKERQGSFEEKLKELQKEEERRYERIAELKTRLAQVEKEMKGMEKYRKKGEKVILGEEHIAQAIAVKTGIPVAKIHNSEKELLIGLEEYLKKAVIGQDEAILKVASAIRRGRSGIQDPKRPIGSFLFLGPTGVGKTELARTIAREVFGGENALIKIDMSEFGEKHNASRLVGAPAGYVGYEDGGKLTEAVRRRPYAVVLFDEIEKAHPDVFNLLLQVLEDGVLTDSHGNKVRFNNTVVIMTSNLGSTHKSKLEAMGFGGSSAISEEQQHEIDKAAAMKALEKQMRPELINRLDHIIVFRPLSKAAVEKIADNLLIDLEKRLAAKAYGLKVSKEAKQWLIDKGFDEKNGARPLRRAIEEYVESAIANAIIAGEVGVGEIVEIVKKGEGLGVAKKMKNKHEAKKLKKGKNE